MRRRAPAGLPCFLPKRWSAFRLGADVEACGLHGAVIQVSISFGVRRIAGLSPGSLAARRYRVRCEEAEKIRGDDAFGDFPHAGPAWCHDAGEEA